MTNTRAELSKTRPKKIEIVYFR